jgi:anti-sigma factor RsiW
MIDMTLPGPCADYEHDLVELHDGALGPERARVIRLHLESCARCRAWAEEFAAVDAGLEAALPRPALAPGFEARLEARLAGLTRQNGRGARREAVELEHDSLVESLRRGARVRATVSAVGWAGVTLCALAAARSLLVQNAGVLSSLPDGPERWVAFGAIGVVVAVAGLAWSTVRNGLPLPGLTR